MKIRKFNEEKSSIEGMKFFLTDENSEKNKTPDCYWFYVDFSNQDDLSDFTYDDSNFELFMDKMETSHEKWAGVHDVSGGENEWGYSSYEIEDFETAIKMWFNFFKNKRLTLENKIYISTYTQMENDEFSDFINEDELKHFLMTQDANKYNI